MALGLKSHEQLANSSSSAEEKVSGKRRGIKRAILDGLEGKKDRLQSYLALGIFAIGLLNALKNIEPINFANIPNAPTAVAAEYNYSGDQFASEITQENTVIYLDANQEPVAYSFINSETGRKGEPILFTVEQQEYLMAAKQKAQETGLPQLAQFVVEDNENPLSALDKAAEYTNQDEIHQIETTQPEINELAEGILSPEELASFGVTIINPDSSSPQLFFLESIFDNGMLTPLKDLRSLGVDQKVVIIPIDAPFVDWDSLTSDQVGRIQAIAGDFFPMLKAAFINKTYENTTAIELSRQYYLAGINNNIQKYQEMYDDPSNDYDKKELLNVIQIYQRNKLLVESLTPQEYRYSSYQQSLLFSEFSNTKTGTISSGFYIENPKENVSFVISRMGEGDANLGDRILFWVSPDGSLQSKSTSIPSTIDLDDMSIKPGDNFQTLENFTLDEKATVENGEYIFQSRSPIITIRHELSHFALITLVNKILEIQKQSNPDYKYPWFEELISAIEADITLPNSSEYLTDALTIAELVRAQELREKENDPSGYPFVIKLPKNKIAPDGSWIISEMLPKEPSNQGLT